MKKAAALLFAIMIVFSGYAQEYTEETEKETVTVTEEKESKDKFGPNKTHFVHAYLSLGFMTPPTEGEGADILYGKSHLITYGVRYKLKLAEFFALGAGVNYTYQVWHMKQVDTKLIPDNTLSDKEKLMSNNLGADAFLRINIGKRKNTIGNYIDLGAYGEWAYTTSRKLTNDADLANDPSGFDYATATSYKLNYFEKINYGVEARLAYGKFVLFGKYRLSDIFTQDFKDAVSVTDMPRLIVGLELGWHK